MWTIVARAGYDHIGFTGVVEVTVLIPVDPGADRVIVVFLHGDRQAVDITDGHCGVLRGVVTVGVGILPGGVIDTRIGYVAYPLVTVVTAARVPVCASAAAECV